MMTATASRKTRLRAIMISRCQGDDIFVTFQLMGIFRFWRNVARVTGRRKGGKGSKRLRENWEERSRDFQSPSLTLTHFARFFLFPSPSTPATQARRNGKIHVYIPSIFLDPHPPPSWVRSKLDYEQSLFRLVRRAWHERKS